VHERVSQRRLQTLSQLGTLLESNCAGPLPVPYVFELRQLADRPIARSDRSEDETEALILRRTLKKYKAGQSPKFFARRINREDIHGPNGGKCWPSAIRGNWWRGIGQMGFKAG